MKVHLIDGTYELFRHHYGQPKEQQGSTTGATRGVCYSVLTLLEEGATHVGVATDHVIESFRNDLWPGYKSSAGMPEQLLVQFPLLEDALRAMGVKVWPMVELEADDGLASAAAVASEDPRVEQVIICTPDKDLGQCVRDDRVVQLDRRRQITLDHGGVVEKFGVEPESIPDYLALVGDSADGFPGLPGWGAKSASAVLARFGHLDDIPDAPSAWGVNVRSSPALAATLAASRPLVALFRDLATLRIDRTLLADVDELRWRGPTDELAAMCDRLESDRLLERAMTLSRRSQGEAAGAAPG